MAEVKRRLAAIMAVDVVGYSRLMEVDEAGTLARLKTHRLELVDPSIERHQGQIIKTMGDGLLVEFASVLNAVTCAAEIQSRMARRNDDVSAARAIQLRIGINLGDVIVEDDDIFGDGVNLAARLEAMADPGGVCVSAAVRDQIGERGGLAFEDLGEKKVKNIRKPVRAYRIAMRDEPSAPAPPAKAPLKPAIAVLPFVNMSGDAEQEFFVDGLTEDIITELSRFRELLVISRNSVFVHKGKPIRVKDVAREFAVDYVVEGSVRKMGERVRVTVQLIDAQSDTHIWAERYDRELKDIFAIQDEVTASIVATLQGRVEAAAHQRVTRKPTSNMAAYECVLAAKILHHRSERLANAQALEMVDRALALDPNYAHAHAWKGCIVGQSWLYGWCSDMDASYKVMSDALEIALRLDDNDADVHRVLAAVNIGVNNFDKAVYHQERALTLNPNSDLVVVQQGEILTWLGRPQDGADWIKKAMRLNPYHPERFWNHLGRAHFTARMHADTIACFSRVGAPDYAQHAFMAAASAHMGNATAAAAHAREVLAREPNFTTSNFLARALHYKQDADAEHCRDGLLKAGLPA
ncbi:MAG: adenylate/guanylate cyclase domain-containing protein [Pseudomonadota bacterium]